jgi:hypothetical protein
MKNFLSTYPLHDNAPATAIPAGLGIPDELRSMLDAVKGNSYAGGYFRFVPSGEFAPSLALWGLEPADCFVFLKCGFGQLVFLHEQQYKVLNPVFNSIDELDDVGGLEFVMDVLLCDRPGMEASFLIDVYEAALPRLGPPALDDMYAFVPALGLGGPRDAAQVQKKKMETEMAILAQL